MADFFEKSLGSTEHSNFDGFDTYALDLNQHFGNGDISIFSTIDQDSYRETMDNIQSFLCNETTVDSVNIEKNRILKQLYGDINNFEVEEFNFFTKGTS